MMGCRKARSELAGLLGGELPGHAGRRIEKHLDRCEECRRELASLKQVTSLVRAAPLEHAPPSELEERTIAVVTGTATPSRRVVSPAEVSRSRNRLLVSIGVPALAAALLITGFMAADWRSDVEDMESQLGAFKRTGGGSPVQSLSFTSGTDEGPHADGELLVQPDGTYRLMMWVGDLSATPPGQHYEVWLSGEQGWVSAGSYKVATTGDVAWACPIGVRPSDFPEVWVTLEPDDGDPRRTGPSVLRATLEG